MSVGTQSAWLEGLTIPEVLDRTLDLFGTRDALIFPLLSLRWTYQQFAAQVDQAARGLMALGIHRGEHVAIWSTNLPEWIVLQFATARIGAVLVTINPAYRAHELEYVLRQSDAVLLVLTDRFKSSDYIGMLAEVCPEVVQNSGTAPARHGGFRSIEFPKLRQVVTIKGNPPPAATTWQQMLKLGNAVPLEEVRAVTFQLSPTDPINIQYTSGTTGFPKAAMLSHRNLLLNVFYSGQCQSLSERDRICIPVPFYHCFGCVLGTLMSMVYGAAMVVPAESFEPGATLDAIKQERCTSLYGVPTMFIAELNDPTLAGRDINSLRTGIMAGSPCPIETMRSVVDMLGCREITIGYGQTEASPIITQTRIDDPLELRVHTVGRPLPGLEVKIVNPTSFSREPTGERSAGSSVGENQPGELCARGHCVMLGYYNDPQATAEAIDAEGWLHTGDLAICLPNGSYKITGRIKDMVIRGGENIYPREIEEFLFTHPAVEQAAVVGVPDAKFGEELCAWIKLKAGFVAESAIGSGSASIPPFSRDAESAERSAAAITPDQIRDFCRAKFAKYKVPHYVKFVTEFPQTVTGKIQKFKIREQMCNELGLKEQETA
ncbi:MAG TPA: AMP-binding protein [Pirellulales bacterium]|jgi:fatty-acyl-CoA synthase|nr:AMP-binding protein [Pirellulales bacterium]